MLTDGDTTHGHPSGSPLSARVRRALNAHDLRDRAEADRLVEILERAS